MAAADETEPVPLRVETAIDTNPQKTTDPLPAFLQADEIEGHADQETVAKGKAQLRKRGQYVFGDVLRYISPEDRVQGTGNVRLEQFADVAIGPYIDLYMSTDTGYMDQPVFRFAQNGASGSAKRLDFEGTKQYRLNDARYTTCSADDVDWHIRASNMKLDYNESVGSATHATMYWGDTPFFYWPYLTFALQNKRKSGFLAPRIGSTSIGGLDLSLPYYWNIAPDQDATLTARFLARRGLMMEGQYRYLDPRWSGTVQAEVLPADRVRRRTRYGVSWQHTLTNMPNWWGAINFNAVSDDDYFRDFSSRVSVTSQAYLWRDLWLLRAFPDSGQSVFFRYLRFQTVQDPKSPISAPYEMTPSLTYRWARTLANGMEVDFMGQFDNFRHPTLTRWRRVVMQPTVVWPFRASYGEITPKLSWHHTRYEADRNPGGITARSASRSLPIFSLDAKLVWERETSMLGRGMTQTLEPRLYYVRIPYKRQDHLPNMDSGDYDYDYTQLFKENRYSGHDRINDANQVTAGLTTRLYDGETGEEKARLGVAQRYYLRDQLVVLPGGTPRKYHASDLLFTAGVSTRAWMVDGVFQFNPNNGHLERAALDARYHPETHKVLNLSYRVTRAALTGRYNLRQIDVSGQWPISKRWYGVARWNYSIQDRKTLESVVGLEYNGGCWVFRVVGQRAAVATGLHTSSLFLQLELNEVARIGSSPLGMLSRSIPGYELINTRPTALQTEVYR